MSGAALPPAVRRGDTIVVIAPSSPFEHVLAWRGMGFLAERYRVRFTRGLFARDGYLAGSDARRAGELREALADPRASAIIAARGGSGASRFVHSISFAPLADRPRWLVGFSDVTALHVEASRVGVASLHAPNLTGLGRGDAKAREAFIHALEAPDAPRVYRGLETLVPGRARGPLFGGNLTMLHACAAAGRLAVPPGSILLVEDVTERPYRIDRMIATLAVGGHWKSLAGVVLGDFTACDPGPDGVTAGRVLEEAFGALGVPVARGLPVGHGVRNDPVVLGALVTLDARPGAGELMLGR